MIVFVDFIVENIKNGSHALVPHTCNPSYLGGRD
jgi:hypothetical protein